MPHDQDWGTLHTRWHVTEFVQRARHLTQTHYPDSLQQTHACGSSESDCVLKNEHREKNRLTSPAPQACLP